MKHPGAIMTGAQDRLLPPSVPFRFFVAAAVFHVVAWGLLALGADMVSSFTGGLGLVLAAVHALTLGVLMTTVMGAAVQILPVVAGQSLMAVWPMRLVSWLLFPGAALLVYGFTTGELSAMTGGAALSIAAVCIFAVLVGNVLFRTRGMTLLVAHGWVSLASLVAVAVLGTLLVVDIKYAVIPDRDGANISHMILAVFGFMGMLAFGYSHILVPMFALSAASGVPEGLVPLVISIAAMALGVGGALSGADTVLAAAAGIAVVAAVLHILTMLKLLKQGMRKRLGVSFILVKASWGMLPVSLIVGGASALGLLGEGGTALFGFLVLFGWLLTFLLGILQRIIPFLAAMNAAEAGRTPPLLSQLMREFPLKFHAVCHFTALALVLLGIVLEHDAVVLGGTLAGLAGSLAFLWFTVDVIRRMRAYRLRERTVDTSQSFINGET